MHRRPGQSAPGSRILLMFLFLFLTALSTFAQADRDKKITIHFSQQSLPQCLKQLSAASGTAFAYDEEQLKSISVGPLDFKDEPVMAILDNLLKGSGYAYKVVNGSIVISPIPKPVKKVSETETSMTLRGRIVDFDSYQPLAGATVVLQETGQSVLSDEKGYYTFKNLPEGSYTLIVTYAGYQKNWLPGVTTIKGRQVSADVKMLAGKSLGEVVVQAGARKVKAVTHTTEKELVTEIRNSTGILSGISSELISKTADRNAADVVKRIPGITVVDNRLIVVRGMNERYNLTYLNDNIAPSTELNSKAFAYDLLPSSIIDRIIVYKSPRADLNGEIAGAAIKVYTRNAMPVRHFDIGIQIAHRPGSTMSDIHTYNGGKTDWLGIDDGTRKLPGFSPGYFQTGQNAGNISQTKMVQSFTPTLTYRQIRSTPDLQVYANYYNSFRLGHKARLFDLTSFTFTRETTNYDVYRQSGNTYTFGADGNTANNLGTSNKIMNSAQTTQIGKFNLLENLTLRLDPKNTIQFKNFLVNDGRSLTSINDSRFNALPHYDPVHNLSKDIILSFQQRLLYSGNLGGKHDWGKVHPQQLEWNLGYTHDLQDIPDQRIAHFVTTDLSSSYFETPELKYVAAGTNTGDGTYGMISRLFIRQVENNYNASADYSYTLNDAFKFRFGTFQLFKTREVGRRIFLINRGGLNGGELTDPYQLGSSGGWIQGNGVSNPAIIGFRLQDLSTIWNPANFPQDGSGLGVYDATSPVDRYVASEQNNSFYGMGDWQTRDKRISFNGGLRVEYDRQKVSGANYISNLLRVVYAIHPRTSVLPSVNLTWRPDSIFVARMSYGKTVNRPEFRELAPYNDYDYVNNEMVTGNPNLVSATIDNYDIRFELYPRSQAGNEMIDIGAFYKKLQNPIERLRQEVTGNAITPFTRIFFANAPSADLYGIEAEIKKNLSFLGGSLFRRLTIVLNGTWTKSSTKQYDVSEFGGINQKIILKGRPLQGQSPYVLNGGLFYEHPGIGSKIGLTYNVNGPVIYAKSVYNKYSPSQAGDPVYQESLRPDLLQLPTQLLDFSYTQRIIRSLQVKFSIQNILDQAYRIVEDQNYNQKYDPERAEVNKKGETYYQGDNISTKYKPGRYFLLSFTYAF